MRLAIRSIGLLAAALSGLTAQTASVLSAGYRIPEPLQVAPGQMITLFVRRPADFAEGPAVAATTPLPDTLGAISVLLRQTDWPTLISMPVQAVYPLQTCGTLAPGDCSPLVAISVQVPWQLNPEFDQSRRPVSSAALLVRYRGIAGDPFPVQVRSDAIHVRSTCDATLPPGSDPLSATPGPCRAVAFREDGSLITAANPARESEVVTLQFYGLGRADHAPETGALPETPLPGPNVEVGFQFGANLKPVRPNLPSTPREVVLAADRVGIYEVRVTVPAVPKDLPSCTASTIVSNLTITIAGAASYDGAGICVE
ncbi:MAG: hypothetical protein NZV14_20025 [Bryobacteraceae bacterium]|nr:hypothetical protein [Bryobacteraceae bacterium]MDW8380454.1 hypothetical protein [Bryobacterales bacterium]